MQGAAGALGTALIQVARALELNIIAIASTDAKLKMAADLGAHTTLNSEREDIVEAVKEATGGKGVNILVEITGGEMVQKSLKMLANLGRLMIVGAASGEQASINPGCTDEEEPERDRRVADPDAGRPEHGQRRAGVLWSAGGVRQAAPAGRAALPA